MLADLKGTIMVETVALVTIHDRTNKDTITKYD